MTDKNDRITELLKENNETRSVNVLCDYLLLRQINSVLRSYDMPEVETLYDVPVGPLRAAIKGGQQ